MRQVIRAAAVLVLAAVAATPAMAQRTDIVVGLVLEPPHMDPTSNAAAAIDEVVYANLFEGLTRFGPDGDILPGLAQSWDVSEDGLTYTFHLADGGRRRLFAGPGAGRGFGQCAEIPVCRHRKRRGDRRSDGGGDVEPAERQFSLQHGVG